MKTDALFYRLFQALPGLVFELAGLDDLDGRSYRFRSEEVKQTAFRLDGLLEPPETNPDAPVVFVEVQMQAEEEFYGRLVRRDFSVSVPDGAGAAVAGGGDPSRAGRWSVWMVGGKGSVVKFAGSASCISGRLG